MNLKELLKNLLTYKEFEMDKKDFIYVCYVQNNLGVLDGEEPISSMIVTRKQDIIDKWLTEQINEARENGYTPDENVKQFVGKTDYYFTVSKGKRSFARCNF